MTLLMRHGKLLTHERQQLVRDYLYKRVAQGDGSPVNSAGLLDVRFLTWVNGFEWTMLHGRDIDGLGSTSEGRAGERVPGQATRVAISNYSGLAEAIRRELRARQQVD